MDSKGLRVNVKKLRMMSSNENAGNATEEVSMKVLFPERVWAVVLSSASFACVGCMRDLMVSVVNLKKTASFNCQT